MLVLQLSQIGFEFLLTRIDRSVAFKELVHTWNVLCIRRSRWLNGQFIFIGYFNSALFSLHALQSACISVELQELLDVLVYFFVLLV